MAATAAGRPQHLLVQVVDLAVARREGAPEPAEQEPLRRRVRAAFASASRSWNGFELVGRQRPLGHLEVRGRRERRRGPAAGARRSQSDGRTVSIQSAFSSTASKKRLIHAALAPAQLVRARPAAELLAVVAHQPDARAIGGRVVAQVRDRLVDAHPRHRVAQPLLAGKERQTQPWSSVDQVPHWPSRGTCAARRWLSSTIVQA